MELGRLVREECSDPDKARLGTIVKTTRYELGNFSSYSSVTGEPPEPWSVIRPGHVVSVRWQDEVTSLTAHVFYDGIKESVIDLMGGNSIAVVE